MVSAVNPNISLLPLTNENIKALPNDVDEHVGDFFYKIRACVLIDNVCVVSIESNQAVFSIFNPCEGTSPLVQSFTNSLTAPRLLSDTLDLSSEFSPWPFLDTID